MARIGDLGNLTYDQLHKLSEQVAEAKKNRKSEEAKAVKTKIEDLLKRSGFTISALYGLARGSTRSARKSATVQYRNPNDRSQVWTGRGRRPFWLVEALKKKGATLKDFQV